MASSIAHILHWYYWPMAVWLHGLVCLRASAYALRILYHDEIIHTSDVAPDLQLRVILGSGIGFLFLYILLVIIVTGLHLTQGEKEIDSTFSWRSVSVPHCRRACHVGDIVPIFGHLLPLNKILDKGLRLWGWDFFFYGMAIRLLFFLF